MPLFRSPHAAFTMVELVFAAGLLAIVAMLFAQMVTSGGRSLSYAVWYKEKLADSQRFFHELEGDLKTAATPVVIDHDQPDIRDQLREGSSPFQYYEGTEQRPVESPLSDELKEMDVIVADTTSLPEEATAVPLFRFHIRKPRIESGPYPSPGYDIEVRAWLQGQELHYSRRLLNGVVPVAERGRLFDDRRVLSDLRYVHISHTPIHSRLDGEVKGALVYLYVFCENVDVTKGGGKGTGIKQSFKINVAAEKIR